MIQNLGGRKFLLAMFTVAVSAALVWLEHISDGVFSAVGGYFTANVTQKATSKAVP